MTTDTARTQVISEMRRARRVRLGLENPTPQDPCDLQIEPATPRLSPRLATLLHDRQFKALFKDHDAIELEALLHEVDVLLARCGLHRRLAQLDRAWRNRRALRLRNAAQARGARSGRRKGAVNFAAHQYGLGLAMIWFEHTGRPPSRYDSTKSKKCSYTGFVQQLTDAAVPHFRWAPGGPSVEYVVRTSIPAFRAACSAGEEYRRRGLLPERSLLDGTSHGYRPFST